MSRPGKVSLASAYAVGYCALAMAPHTDDAPDWYGELDPLETLFLGTTWPGKFRDSFEFANACSAWLRMMRPTPHWPGIEDFVAETLAASEEHDLPVDEGELMLLLAGRLEAAGLNQQQLPRDLLPDRALQSSRFIGVGADKVVLPVPLPDAAERIAEFWASCQVDLPGNGTAVDALREGFQLFIKAGIDVRGSAVMLLVALYAVLVAREDEDLTEAGGRAAAWALGLEEDSPLVPVTDIMLAAAELEMDVDVALGHLFGLGEFTEPVRPRDRGWHSSPGTALISLAFEFGHRQVVSRQGKSVRLGAESAALLEHQRRQFEEKFGRPMGPDDPVFFDPDSDEPRPISLLDAEHNGVAMLEAAGVSPAWIYAHQHTEGLLPLPDGSFATARDEAEWNEAIDRYVKLHQPGVPVDHDAEVRKLQSVLVGLTLQIIADDPEYGSSFARRIDDPREQSGEDGEMIRQYLDYWADDLMASLRTDSQLASAAGEYARAWAGADLAGQVRAAAEASEIPESYAVLLAVAVATGRESGASSR